MKKIVRFLACGIVSAFLALTAPKVYAADSTVYTVDVAGLYRSPADGVIEDSGGESQEALGQSMVDSVVGTVGVLQENSDGSYGLYVRFSLMDNISDVSFQIMTVDGGDWSTASYVETGSTTDTTDFYISIPSKESYVRAECFVDAMGRSVIFFMSYDNLVEGNSTDLAMYSGSISDSDTEEYGSSEATEDTTTEDSTSTTATGAGLTIGYATDESGEELTDDGTALSTDGVIDDSVWMMLFLVVFIATFTAGLLLILVVVLIRKIQSSHEEIRKENIKKLDRYQIEKNEDEFYDFAETNL